MRTAINIAPRTQSFQFGGGVPESVQQQQASPVQPPPGQAGPVTPATPPTVQLAPTPLPPQGGGEQTAPAPLPPQAIQTQQPEPPFDDNADLQASTDAANAVFDDQHVFSHRGDNRPISFKVDTKALDPTGHPDYERIKRAGELIQTMPEGKQKKDYATWYKGEVSRINRDLVRTQQQEFNKSKAAEKSELTKIDAASMTPDAIAKYDDQLALALQNVTKDRDEELKSNDPSKRHTSEETWQASALNKNVMAPAQLLGVARNLQALNTDKQLNSDQALKLAIRLTQSVPQRAKGANGFTGRGGANYVPHGTDLIGNRWLRTELGTIRISKDALSLVDRARANSYDQRLKYKTDLQKQREEPTLMGRALRAIGME